MEFLFLAAGVALAVSANDRRNSRRASSGNYTSSYGRSSSLTDGPFGMCYFCNLHRCRCSPVASSSLSSAPIPAFRNQQLVARSTRVNTPSASTTYRTPKPIAKSAPVKPTTLRIATQPKVTAKLANLAHKSSSGRKLLSLSGLFRRTPKRGVQGQPGSQQMSQQPVRRNEKEKASEQEKKSLLLEKPLNPPSFQVSTALT